MLLVLAIMIGVAGVSCAYVSERSLAADYGYTMAGSGPHPDLTVVLDRLDNALLARISGVSGVASAKPSQTASTQWHISAAPGHADFTIVAFPNPAHTPLSPIQLLSGRYPELGEIVMEYGDSALQHVAIGDHVVVDTATGTAALRVVGIARTAGQNPAVTGQSIGYMNTAGLDALPMNRFETGKVPVQPLLTYSVDLTLRSPAQWHGAASAIGGVVKDAGATVLSVVPPQDGASLDGVQNIFSLIWILIGVALLLAVLLVANAVTALIADDVTVIGTMKALGGTRQRVACSYLTTVTLYGAAATPVGLALGVLAGARLAHAMASSIPLADGPFRLAPATIALGIATGLGVPLLAALLPLWLGTRVTVRQALATWGVALVQRAHRIVAPGWLPPIVSLGLRGLFRRPWRAALSVATVALAAVCFLVIQTLVTSVDTSIGSVWSGFSADVELYVGGQESVADVRSVLSGVPGIASFERVGWYGAPTPWGKASAWGVEPDSRLFRAQLTGGRWFTPADRDVVMLSDAMAARSHVPIGASFPVAGPGGTHTVTMTVIGTVHEAVDDPSQVGSIVLPVNELYEREGADSATVAGFTNRVLVVARDRSAAGVDRLARAIDAAGRTARGGPIAEVFLFHDEVDRHQRTFIPLYDLLYAMGLVIAAVGILGLADGLGASVVQRRRDIGLMRSLGATGRQVGSVFTVEGLTVSTLAWVVGAVVGTPLAYMFVGVFRSSVMPVDVVFWPAGLLVMFGVTAVIAALAAIAPAWRAASLRTVDLIRHE
jgi:putative ABC transport system permease protein